LKFLSRISNGFGFVFGSNLFLNDFACGFVDLQQFIRCKSLNLSRFFGKLGFRDSEPKLFEFLTDLHRFGFVVVLERKREVSLWFLPGFNRRFELESSRTWNL